MYIERERKRTYNSRPKGHALGADADGVRGVLDVGAGDVLALLGEEAGADAELGVGACRRSAAGFLHTA